MVRRDKNTAEMAASILDRFVNELDANMLICGLLGGMAAYGGILPPFTRLLMMTSQASGGISGGNLIKSDWDKAYIAIGSLGPGALTGGAFASIFGVLLKNQYVSSGMTPQDAKIKAAEITQNAAFCSGALESMLMYKAMSQPGLLEAVIKAPAEMLKGVGEIVPG